MGTPEETHGKRFAVIENEFGEIGIDDKLIARREDLGAEQIIEMNNGCICCTATWWWAHKITQIHKDLLWSTLGNLFFYSFLNPAWAEVRGDLIQGLRSILKKTTLDGNKLDGVIIETTGLADPAPVAQTFFADDVIQARMTLAPWLKDWAVKQQRKNASVPGQLWCLLLCQSLHYVVDCGFSTHQNCTSSRLCLFRQFTVIIFGIIWLLFSYDLVLYQTLVVIHYVPLSFFLKWFLLVCPGKVIFCDDFPWFHVQPGCTWYLIESRLEEHTLATACFEAFEHKDGIITVVDAKHCLQHLHEEKPEGVENEAVEQLAFADRIIVNKTDLVRELSWNVANFPSKKPCIVDGLMSFVWLQDAVHRSQRPSFQSSLERFERSMVLHPWSTLRAMFAAGWIVAVWCFDSEISSCRRAILKIMLESKSSIKVRKGVQTAVNSTEAFDLDSPRNSKVQVQEIMGTLSPEFKKTRLSFWSLENPLTGKIHVATSHALNRWGIKGFSLDRVLESDAEFLRSDQDHQHDQSVSSAFRLEFEEDLLG